MGVVGAEEIMNSWGRRHGFLLCDVECTPILGENNLRQELLVGHRQDTGCNIYEDGLKETFVHINMRRNHALNTF